MGRTPLTPDPSRYCPLLFRDEAALGIRSSTPSGASSPVRPWYRPFRAREQHEASGATRCSIRSNTRRRPQSARGASIGRSEHGNAAVSVSEQLQCGYNRHSIFTERTGSAGQYAAGCTQKVEGTCADRKLDTFTPSSIACTDCSTGGYALISGTDACSSCLPGQYLDVSKRKSCSAGTYTESDGQATCITCRQICFK